MWSLLLWVRNCDGHQCCYNCVDKIEVVRLVVSDGRGGGGGCGGYNMMWRW